MALRHILLCRLGPHLSLLACEQAGRLAGALPASRSVLTSTGGRGPLEAISVARKVTVVQSPRQPQV